MKSILWGLFSLIMLGGMMANKPEQNQKLEFENKKGIEIINANWFDGERFISAPLFITEGLFSLSPPAHITQTIDAKEGYLLPPFAEAHNHNIFPLGFEATLQNYIEKGVLYAMSQGNICSIRDSMDPLVNHAQSIDVQFANGGFTSKYGHDVALNHSLFSRGVFGAFGINSIEELEGDAYYIIENEDEIEEKLSQFLACKPDFLKVFVSYSEENAIRRNDSTYFGASGLSSDILPKIVQMAHERGLRVSAHVETAIDFHAAIKAHVDIIAHLPGYEIEDTLNSAQYLITAESAKLAAEQGIAVLTTTRLNYSFQRNDPVLYEQVEKVNKKNLSLLKKYGVKLGVGSDRYAEVSVLEAMGLFEMGIFSEKELLKMWIEDTPKIIFPERKIGKIAEGYEANFIVLRKNPLLSFNEAINSSYMTVKRGEILYPG